MYWRFIRILEEQVLCLDYKICIMRFILLLLFSLPNVVYAQDIEGVFSKLVWADEFDGTGAIDTAKWFHQTQFIAGNSWANGELQHYTNREVNSYVSNGTLKIKAAKESFTDQNET